MTEAHTSEWPTFSTWYGERIDELSTPKLNQFVSEIMTELDQARATICRLEVQSIQDAVTIGKLRNGL